MHQHYFVALGKPEHLGTLNLLDDALWALPWSTQPQVALKTGKAEMASFYEAYWKM